MIITIEHFTCTSLAKQNLLPIDLHLTNDEKEVLDLIAFYESSSVEHKAEIESIFNEMAEHVNLSRLVALKLLNYHVEKYTQPAKSTPEFDELFGSVDSYPVQQNSVHQNTGTHNTDRENIDKPQKTFSFVNKLDAFNDKWRATSQTSA